MKNLLLSVAFIFAFIVTVFSKNYYVAANGSNANTGLTPSSPWQTIAKVNASFSGMAAGDSILFRRGDSFYGALVIGKSGASGRPIVISAYGTGAKPIITGFVNVSSWTSVGNGIYQSNIPGAKATLNMVAINNVPQALGRYPNITDANGGYLSYESFSGYTSITDNQLTSSTNWTGAEVVIRKKLWVLDRCKVTAHTGNKLTFTNTNGSTYDGTNGFGYFFQNDIRTLDRFGEWYFNSSKNLQVYFGTASPSSYSIRASNIDTLMTINAKSYININNIAFEGANGDAIYATNGSYVNIQNCDFVNSGASAINIQAVSNLLIENCTTNNMLNTAFAINNTSVTNTTVRGCSVKNTGTLAGMGLSNGNSYKAIQGRVSSNLLIEYNTVDTSGYVGIEFQGSGINIRYNVVNHFCYVKDDGGGIYTWASGTDAAPGPVYTNRTVSNNIVMNGIGAPNGRNSPSLFVSGIYCDGRTMNLNVLNNTIFNVGKNGIHCNNPNTVTIKGNTSYNNLNAMSVMRWTWGNITNLTIRNNVFFPKLSTQRCLYYTNAGLNQPTTTPLNTALSNLGNIDSNIYSMFNPTGFNFEIYATAGGAAIPASQLSLEGWRANSNHDHSSKKPSKFPVAYKVNNLVGSNKFTNSLFSNGVSGLTLFGTASAVAWDNTGKINGGALKLSFNAPVANKYTTLYSSIGAVSATKKYIMRFSTYGTTQQGFVRVYLRQAPSPYTSLTPMQIKTFGTGRQDHEVLFDAPTTNSSASFVLEFEQNSGTAFLDNVEFYEANATVYDTESQIRFEYNATKNVKTVALDARYTGADGTAYSGSLTLQPFSSVIMIKDTGTTVVAPPPATSLQATASAPSINCYGGTTAVNVTATGGTAPYTGTGTFTAAAGTGSLKLSFPSSVAGRYTLLYYTVGAISSTKNYVFKFSTLGTSSAGKLRASIRQTASPFNTITARQDATFGTSRKDHQFVFTAPASQTAASFQIEIEQSSGTTYIDNVAFFECDADGTARGANLFADGQFEGTTNKMFAYSGNNNHQITWDKTGKISATHYFTVKDASNNSSVASVTVNQPPVLNISATAGIINVLGGTTNVVVTATGGTAPYTGTGTFSVLAGLFNYTVTDSKGCTASTSVTILPFLGRPATSTAARTAADPSARIAQQEADDLSAKTLTLNAYPNPTSNSFNLRLTGGTVEKVAVQVFGFDGRLVYQATGTSNAGYAFGNSFAQGVYTVKVTQGGNVKTLRLVKGGN